MNKENFKIILDKTFIVLDRGDIRRVLIFDFNFSQLDGGAYQL